MMSETISLPLIADDLFKRPIDQRGAFFADAGEERIVHVYEAAVLV